MNSRPTIDEPGTFSRRALLAAGAAAGATLLVGNAQRAKSAIRTPGAPTPAGPALTPHPAIPAILGAIDERPIVAIGERHDTQDFHDVLGALLHHPELPDKIDDIVVEFGSSHYQPLMDAYILKRAAIPRSELVQVWRQIGDVTWNAPVYEQFFRTVRAVNWTLPADKRIRVLLGQPPVTMSDLIAHPHNRADFTAWNAYTDRNMATVVETEVLARGRRALVIAGSAHTLKGLRAADDPSRPNAATTIEQRRPGSVYSTDLLLIPPSPTDPALRQLLASSASWPEPSILPLAGTAIGALTSPLDGTDWVNGISRRALTPADMRFEHQADALLWLGPGSSITISQPDPAIYHWGPYAAELKRFSPIAHSTPPGLTAAGERLASGPANWFAYYGRS